MDGRLLLGAFLVVAGCLPADDLKGYSEGSEPARGAGTTTDGDPATTSGQRDPPLSSVSGEAGAGVVSSNESESPLAPALDPGPSQLPGDGAGGAEPSSGADDGAPASEGDDDPGPAPADADGDPEPPAPPPQFRFVRLVADSAVQGPYTAIAEFNVLDGDGASIDRSSWQARADSEETVYVGGAGARFAIDGEAVSMWHTAWFDVDPPPPHPHTLDIDMGSLHAVSGFRYLGRQDQSLDGRVAAYRFFVSVDGVEWGDPVVAGTLENSTAEQEVRLR